MASTDSASQAMQRTSQSSTSVQASSSQSQAPIYTISTLPSTVGNIAVHSYRIVARQPSPPRRNDTDDLWSIHLMHSGGSVELRMVDLQRPDGQGQLQIASLPVQGHQEGVRWWTFEASASSGRTVHGALSLITNRGRERYRFNHGGSGGRFWVRTCMIDFDRENFITKLSSDYTELAQVIPRERGEEQEGRFV